MMVNCLVVIEGYGLFLDLWLMFIIIIFDFGVIEVNIVFIVFFVE